MAKCPAFVLPEALGIEIDEHSFSLRHDGDVVLEQTLGRPIKELRVGGDLTLRLPSITGRIVCGGTLTLHGEVDAEVIEAKRVVIGGQRVRCKAIAAQQHISIGPAEMLVDAILAPHIEIDPSAHGRVKVIQSDNDRSATRIKGGFSLADYEDMFGDADAFLAGLGLEGALPGVTGASEGTPVTAAPALIEEPDEDVQLRPTAVPRAEDSEDTDDPLSLSLEDLEPVGDDEVQIKLNDALNRIIASYDGGELPPAVEELRRLINAADRKELADNITAVWNGLLKFHQKRGIRPHHQVTHAFNVIHSLVS